MGGGKRLSHEEEVRLGLVKEEAPLSPEVMPTIQIDPIDPIVPIEVIKIVIPEKQIKKPVKKIKKVIKRRKK